jgi:hypothetical protein
MATTGNNILKSEFPTGWSRTYESHVTTTLYVSAASFVIHCGCSSVWLRTSKYEVWFYCYDWDTSSWVYKGYNSQSQKNGGSKSWKFYHNRAAEGTTDFDDHYHHFWKIVFSETSPGSSTCDLLAWAGGVGLYTDSEYEAYAKNNGKHIISAGRLGADMFHAAGSGGDDATALSYFKWSNNSDTPLLASYADKMIAKWKD